jgi:quinol monooxygenase YgiN
MRPPRDSRLTIPLPQRYSNQDAFTSHMVTQQVVDMFAWANGANVYQRPTIVTNLTYSANLEFFRPEVAKQQDPCIVLRETDYIGGNLSQYLPLIQAVVNISKNETGMFLCGAYTDPTNSTRLFTLEVTISREYFLEFHSESQAYQHYEKSSRSIVNGTEIAFLKLQGGFLYKAT